MMQALLAYTAFRYGNIATNIITEMFQEEFPYMNGYHMALLIPEKHINKETVSEGLLSDIINQGAVITK